MRLASRDDPLSWVRWLCFLSSSASLVCFYLLLILSFQFIGNLSKLTSLDCSNNDIYEVADDLCKCIHMGDLNLNFNNIAVRILTKKLGVIKVKYPGRGDGLLIAFLLHRILYLLSIKWESNQLRKARILYQSCRTCSKFVDVEFGIVRFLLLNRAYLMHLASWKFSPCKCRLKLQMQSRFFQCSNTFSTFLYFLLFQPSNW